MTSGSTVSLDGLVRTLEEAGVRHVVHLGGGDGSLLAALLARLPSTTGLLCDQPRAVATAAAVLQAANVSDRVDVLAEDAPDAIPPGGDAYLITPRQRDDASNRAVVDACRAIIPQSALLIVWDDSPRIFGPDAG